ncbi:type IV toxin-antitoxin system AbiEi family antitoxin domain-containing protein [Breznakia pachnodae]|uniref:Transcriptional regulator of viral defense system n=1 Tax=Breznakia pachnodae TaxID=265178 RepID=A0ABU0E247_9FIRM|nr:hypothetical protein [Breznakia pachnodae]MDQ0360954.1 putative transcriptional regulator of viral defense system [Breznakia pachnodae]
MKKVNKIPNNQKVISINELKNLGYSYYMVNKLVEDNQLIRLNRKYYENVSFEGEDSDFYFVSAYFSSGTICLMSAAVYYGLSTYIPYEIDVAVKRDKKIVTKFDWPKFKIYYFGENRFNIGIDIISDGKNQFQIYDLEKTVIDIIYYRNKVGIEEMKEILINYLKRNDRDLTKLYQYAKQLKCLEVLKLYMDVLV